MVSDINKKIFELRANSWHDPRMMPAVGMFVEFRCADEGGYTIVDCRASSYQSFPEGSLVREIDFWRTNTDDELRQKESDAKAAIAKEIFAKTNYAKLEGIEVSTDAQACIREHFRDEFNAIGFLDKIKSEASGDSCSLEDRPLNYLIVKPFLNKAVDYLVYNDKHASMDSFAEELQIIKQLEYSHNAFKVNVNINIDKIYRETFLDSQHHYKGVLRAIDTFKEKKLQIDNKIRVCNMEVRSLQSKIDAKKGDINVLQARQTEVQNIIKKTQADSDTINALMEKLKAMCDNFVKDNYKAFEVVFNKMYHILITKTKEALDICGTRLDDKAWRLAMESTSIKNTFFRQNVNTPFCAMTFVKHHAERLDKGKMGNNESVVYNYYKQYEKTYKNYAIFTENEHFEVELKVKILALAKNTCVYVFQKEIECFSAMNRLRFEFCFIDAELRLTEPRAAAKAVLTSRLNANTKFALLKAVSLKNLDIEKLKGIMESKNQGNMASPDSQEAATQASASGATAQG